MRRRPNWLVMWLRDKRSCAVQINSGKKSRTARIECTVSATPTTSAWLPDPGITATTGYLTIASQKMSACADLVRIAPRCPIVARDLNDEGDRYG